MIKQRRFYLPTEHNYFRDNTLLINMVFSDEDTIIKQETHQEMRERTWTFLRWHHTCRGQRLRPL